jgi:hypothetical protein
MANGNGKPHSYIRAIAEANARTRTEAELRQIPQASSLDESGNIQFNFDGLRNSPKHLNDESKPSFATEAASKANNANHLSPSDALTEEDEQLLRQAAERSAASPAFTRALRGIIRETRRHKGNDHPGESHQR